MGERSAEYGDLGMVCDAYGLPYSAVALDRHIRANVGLTMEVWKMIAETQTARLAAVRTILDAMGDPTDPKHLHPQAAGLLVQVRDAISPAPLTDPPAQTCEHGACRERVADAIHRDPLGYYERHGGRGASPTTPPGSATP